MNVKDYCVIDTETTGFSPTRHEIIEIAAIRVRNGIIVSKFSMLIKPIVMPSFNTIKIHNIWPRMLEDQRNFSDVYKMFCEFISDDPIVGFNTNYDIRMLQGNCSIHGIKYKINNVVIDVRNIVGPGTLNDHIKKYGIKNQEHRALSDTINTHYLFEKTKNNM
jgi:DNA polymerase III epsilon subunit family exonuclease